MIKKPCHQITIVECNNACGDWEKCNWGKLYGGAAGPWRPVPPIKEDRYLVRWDDGSWGAAYWFDGEWIWDGKLSTSLDPVAWSEINTEVV